MTSNTEGTAPPHPIVTPSDRSNRIRNRGFQFLAIATVIALGLFLRSRWCPLPVALTKYGGDALWALVVFFAVGLLAPRATTGFVATVAIFISFFVETTQLYHAPWIDSIREYRIGMLILGSTFHAPDLIAYAAGVAMGVGIEIFRRREKRAPVTM